MFSGLAIGITVLFMCLPSFAQARVSNSEQNVTLERALRIPGAVLSPGSYIFSIEDSMQDRTVVRIETADRDTHYLLLTVPSGNLSDSVQNGLILFNTGDENARVLRAWMCPGCDAALEFVYPKLEALKITGESGQSVLAVDAESKKLPATLSADDMKVVKLWLLSPKRISADDHENTPRIEKYTPSEEASSSPVPSEPVSASRSFWRLHNSDKVGVRLPRTASHTFSLALWGLLALATAVVLRPKYARSSARERERNTYRRIERVLACSGLLLCGISAWNLLKFTVFQKHSEWFGSLCQFVMQGDDNRRSAQSAGKIRLPPVLIGTLEIPRIDLSVLVVDGDNDESLSVGAGHVPGTALPGKRGNTAIAGHRDTAFWGLQNIKIGDRVRIENGRTYNYVVTSVRIVDPDNIGVLQDTSGEMLTMITCYPFRYFGAAPKRYVVQARVI